MLEPPWGLDPGKGWMDAAAVGGAAGVLLDAGLLGAVVPGEDPGADGEALRRMADGRRLVELAAAAGVAAEASAWEVHLRTLCRRAGIDRGAVSRMADALEVLRG